MPKKKPKVTYGRGQVPHYRSSEALAKLLDKKKREQGRKKEEKEKQS